MQGNTPPARTFVREHTGLAAGLGCLALAVCPLALFSLLQFVGLFPGSNGLGFGLLFAFGAPIALAVIAIGAVLDYVLREKASEP